MNLLRIATCLSLLTCVLPPLATSADTNPLAQSLAIDYWDESRFATFEDGVPLTIDEQLEVERLVARLASLDRRVFYASPAQVVTTENLLNAPDKFRGKPVHWQGELSQLDLPNSHSREETTQVPHTCLAMHDDKPCMIVSHMAPKRWELESGHNRNLAIDGIFVKLVELDDGKLAPLIASRHIEWFPRYWNPPRVNYGMTILGIMGVDASMLDNVAHRQPLLRNETATFYKLLSGLSDTTSNELVNWSQRHMPRHRESWQSAKNSDDELQQKLAGEVLRLAGEGRYSVAPFFNTPDNQTGQLAVFDGVIRRAIRVEVAGDADAAAAGVDHYYELALFTDDSQNNPLMFCVLDVPPEMPLGDDISQRARLAGFFFKSWRYSSRQAENTRGQQLRVAPLFVGRAPLRIVPAPEKSIGGWIAGLGFTGIVALVWLAGWWRARSDRAFAASTLSRIQSPIDPIDIDPATLPNHPE